jgi:exodeoxyribonuclease VIII
MMVAETSRKCPPPGIYENIAFESYLLWDALSNSKLNLAAKSLRHFRYVTAKDPTPSLRFGTLVHCGQLEPMSIAKRYAVMPDFHLSKENRTGNGEESIAKTTKWCLAKTEEFHRVNNDKQICTDKEFNDMQSIVLALCESEKARRYLCGHGPVELSIVWNDPETGLLCKARFDKIISGFCLTDLKSTFNAMKFADSIVNYGYHRQMPHYLDGWKVLTGEELIPALVAVETAAPFCVRAAPVHPDLVDMGRAEVRELKLAVADAKESNEWPGYSSPESWVAPSWYTGGDGEVELLVGGETISI